MKAQKTLMYLAAVIIYGTNGYFLHYINCSSEFVVMCRGLIGSIFILIVMLVKGELPNLKSIKDNIVMLVISGMGLGF